MVSDQQVKRLWRLAGGKLSLEIAAAKAGMDPKTARKYLRDRRLPSEMRQKHTWRTRPDPFADVGRKFDSCSPSNQACRQRRSLSICSKRIRGGSVTDRYGHCGAGLATGERPKGHHEKCSLQEHRPGALCQSDFTHCRELGVTINGQALPHLIYHFVLSYSNWETGSICYSETFESGERGCRMRSGNWAGFRWNIEPTG